MVNGQVSHVINVSTLFLLAHTHK